MTDLRKRFQKKWKPVFRPKTRKNKKSEPGFDSIETEKALSADRRHIWHPFTQHATERDPVCVTRAQGASLFDGEGREILDVISSWWTCVHGHAHPEINRALADQAATLEHVMFAGFTHLPAMKLAEKLAALLPGDINRMFFSDNGSTAVEVALKLAYQYWRNRGEDGRTLFLAFEGGYHGDTLGAMSLGKGSGFFPLYETLMCRVETVPYAPTWDDDANVDQKEAGALARLDELLEAHAHEAAAIIMEPLMQGAGGIRFARPQFVRAVAEHCRAAGLLVIFDEVATGFGRTGTLFAAEQVKFTPDVMCLSKGLTAGYLPMSLTCVRDKVFEAFLADDFSKALAHGHSFTANPLACAVALRSLELFEETGTLARIAQINAQHRAAAQTLKGHARASHVRVLGSILAFDLAGNDALYQNDESVALKHWYLDHGLNIRPLGPAVYMMPPYCITDAELARAYAGLADGLDWLASSAP